MKSLSGNTRIYGLIGHPVSHSLSPFIMNWAFDEHEIDAVYVTSDVESEIGEAVTGMRALGFGGANVTYPHKEAALRFADSVSPEADVIGALNTLRFGAQGIEAFNTDAPGTATALATLGGATIEDSSALVFGAGGAGRAAAFGLLERQAGRVTFAVRDENKGMKTVERFREHFPEREIELVTMSGAPLLESLEAADIIINATPVGMSGYEFSRLIPDDSPIGPHQICFDFVYHPRNTEFLETACGHGARTLDGLALLLAQAEHAFRLWTGKGFSLPKMYEAVTLHVEGMRQPSAQ